MKMIKPETLSEQLLFSTIRIEIETSTGTMGRGTGFFFKYPIGDKGDLELIVTNNHVVKDAVKGIFRLHDSFNQDGNFYPAETSLPVVHNQFEQAWIPHPNPDVDLCAMLYRPLFDAATQQNRVPFCISLHTKDIWSDEQLDELKAVEDILMIGYPIGLWDSVNNLPLVRKGITASHPAIDFDGESVGVIDAACFPGSSGSPVLIVNEGLVEGRGGVTVINRAILLGILFQGPVMTVTGEIQIIDIPTISVPVALSQVMIHLGYYIKAKELLVLGEHVVKTLTEQGRLNLEDQNPTK